MAAILLLGYIIANILVFLTVPVHMLKPCSRSITFIDESFYLLSSMRQGLLAEGYDFHENPGVDGPRIRRRHRHRGVCPYDFVMNHNPHRIPSTVMEARCSCTNCRRSGIHGIDTCRPVYNYRMVEEEDRARNCLKTIVRAFAIACECVLATTTELYRNHTGP